MSHAMASSAVSTPQGWGKRHTIFAIICLVNLTIWLDEGVFGALTPYWSKALNLTPTEIGTGSAAYLLGYFPMLFIAGLLSDKYGARRMLILCVLGCSILSAAMFLVHDYTTLVIRNILFGIFFGFLWAPCNRMITMWLAPHERAQYAAIWFSSCMFSFVIASPLALVLASWGYWQIPFLVVTILGVPGILLLWLAVSDDPEDLSSISPRELAYIRAGQTRSKSDFSWGALGNLLKDRSVVFMIIATCLATTPTWLIGTWGFYQLVNLFHAEGSYVSIVIALCYMVTVLYGFIHGWVLNNVFGGRCRLALAAGPVISAIGFFIAAYTNNQIVLAFSLFALGTLCNPFFWGTVNAYWAAVVKPEYSGTLNGISAGGQVAGGYIMLSLSGTWVKDAATFGTHAVDTVWLIGGVVFLLTVIPVFLAREVYIRRAPVALDTTAGSMALNS